MKKAGKQSRKNLRREYDFSNGTRGKYASRFKRGSNIVVLAEDVAKRFPDSESVNRALRACGEIADVARKPSSRRKTGS